VVFKRRSRPFGVNIVGPRRGTEYGVGESAAQMSRAIAAAQIKHVHVEVDVEFRDGERFFSIGDAKNPYAVNLLTINGFDTWIFHRDIDPAFFEGRFSVVKWHLEVGPMPDWMIPTLEYTDEIWVDTEHVRRLLEPVSPVPVVRITPSVSAPRANDIGREDLGFADDFVFLTMLDLNSSLERKNPLDLIDAYKRAFLPGDGAVLHVKVGNAGMRPEALLRLQDAAGDRPDIEIAARHLSEAERDALMRACDCYVSLHRAEGFGFTMPEAMLAGKPVIATRYSANLDYMNDENSLLVDQHLVPVGEDIDIYPAEGLWAQADVGQASELLRWTFDHPDEARRIGERAKRDAQAMFDPVVAGRAIERRLRERLGQGGRLRFETDRVA
jgi:glycosyltransferase involved in cell wall biosynthesis